MMNAAAGSEGLQLVSSGGAQVEMDLNKQRPVAVRLNLQPTILIYKLQCRGSGSVLNLYRTYTGALYSEYYGSAHVTTG